MNLVRCLIVDDEPLAIDVIENYLARLKDFAFTRCENAVDAIRLLNSEPFDLLFLDIQMPLLTGFDLLRTVKEPPMVIITSAFRDYAVESFEFEVLDYLVKPVSFPRFMRAIERALKRVDPQEEEVLPNEHQSLFLKVDRKLIKVALDEILFIESLRDYIRVTTIHTNLISYQSLTSITDKLPAKRFMRVHRSYTVAIDKIDSMDGPNIILGVHAVPVSRDLKQEVLKLLKNNPH